MLRARIILTLVAVLCWVGTCVLSRQPKCTKMSSCSCYYPNNTVVDLLPLAHTQSPRWHGVWDGDYRAKWYYNPCISFDWYSNCTHASVCRETDGGITRLGTQESATFLNDPTTGNLVLQYNSTDSQKVIRTSRVVLKCGSPGIITFLVRGEIRPHVYEFEMTSSHCCPKSPV